MGPRLGGLDQYSVQQVVAAAQALEAGRADRAAATLTPLLARYPSHPELLRLQAGVLKLRGEHVAAFEAMKSAVSQRPGDALYHNTMATVLAAAGNLDEAVDALKHACALQPDLAVAWYNLGLMLARNVQYDEAIAAFRRAVAIDKDHMLARAQLADMLKIEGDAQGAQTEYRRVLAERPWTGTAWWGLANIKTLRLGEADIHSMQAALRDPQASDEDLVAIGFALGKAYDDEKRYADALAALEQANAVARKRSAWDARGLSTRLDAINATTEGLPVGENAELGREVIFIVGLPRSGSTLMEQILASHSEVEGAGELIDLAQVLTEESVRRSKPFPQWVPEASAADWARLGRAYLQRTAHWRKRRPIFTDKMPGNWVYIGAIRAMLPGARIICCRRDPLETCLGCYRQYMIGNAYTRTFADLAAYWRDYDRSVRGWAQRYPRQVFEYCYEDLQRNPDGYIRGVLEFTGQRFEEACVRFHETERYVRSPSAMQVREPMRQDTARAPRYGSLLDPLRVALGMPIFTAAVQ